MKKVLKGFVSVLSWVVLVFALIMTIFAFSVDKSSGISNLFGFIPLTVESDSMSPTFVQSDLIIDREIDDIAVLKEGDVITFWTIINGNKVINTHRITEVHLVNCNISFTTKGDNNSIKDSLDVYPSDIVGKWTGVKIPALGGIIGFLRTQLGFCICVIIPLALFFLGYLAAAALGHSGALWGGAAFILSICLIFAYDRRVAKQKTILYTVTAFAGENRKKTEEKGDHNG